MQKNKGAFTLVELIVVITILAILATIGFYSFQGFARDSRNSVRISDLRSIEKVLSLYKTYNDVFPKPTNGTLVTDSGSELWEQGTFGVLTRKIVGTSSNISKIPVDPLTGDEYTYSLLNTKREMQLAAVFEGDLSLNLDMVNETYAAGMYGTTYITGDFNGKIVKTGNCNSMRILAIPSLIKGNTDKTDVIEILNEKKLAYKGSRILPESYGGLATFTEQLPEGNIVNTGSINIFEGTCEELKDETIQQEFIDNLKLAFEGTVVEDQTSIKPIIEDPSLYIAQTLINTNVSEKIKVTVNSIPNYLNCLSMTDENVNNLNDAFSFLSSTPMDKENWCNLDSIDFSSSSCSGLSEIPSEIGFLYKLTTFKISSYSNHSCHHELVEIPNEFGNLINLEVLEFRYSDLSKFPINIVKLVNLTSVELTKNDSLGSLEDNYAISAAKNCEDGKASNGARVCIEGNGSNVVFSIE